MWAGAYCRSARAPVPDGSGRRWTARWRSVAGSRSCATVRWCWPCREAKWGRACTPRCPCWRLRPYGIPSQQMAHVATRKGVPVGFWCAVGHSHNAFFSESSVDEIAFELKQDPVALRRQRLTQARATWSCWIWRPAGLSGAAPCRQGGPRGLHCMNRLAPSCRKSPRYLRLAASCRCTVSCVPLNAVWWSTRALLRSKRKARWCLRSVPHCTAGQICTRACSNRRT